MSLVLVLKELAQRPSFPSLPQFCLFVCLLWGALFPRTADPFPNPYAFTLYPYRMSCNWTVSQAAGQIFWFSWILTEPTPC